MKIIFLLLACASLSYADCRVSDALNELRPGAVWNVRGERYNSIEWLDVSQTKPTAAEVVATVAACRDRETTRQTLKAQARATLKDEDSTTPERVRALAVILDLD